MKKAVKELREHQKKLRELQQQQSATYDRMKQARETVEAGQVVAANIAALKAKRRDMLGENYLGADNSAELKDLEAQIQRAESEATEAIQRAEGASAAIDRLQAEYEAMGKRISSAEAITKRLRYAAAIEHAAEALPEYRAALTTLADVHAELLGRCLAADENADWGPRNVSEADPFRPVISNSITVEDFTCPVPNLPGINPVEWVFAVNSAPKLEVARRFIGAD
jgi:hypothetical protein